MSSGVTGQLPRSVTIYPSATPNMPVIYLNTFAEESDTVYQFLQGASCPDFTLVTISGLAWDHDMAPWDIPSKNPYLKIVRRNTEEIETFFSQHNLNTVFQLNPGNHHKNAAQRTASGIVWILSK